jgi:peptide/nickel transport system substrate-binding protein
LKRAAVLGLSVPAIGGLLAACGDDDDDDDDDTSGAGDATATPAAEGTAAATSGTGAEGEPKSGGSLTMSLADSDATNFDPIIPTDNMSIWTMLLIYDQVVRVAADGANVEPGLADKWEASEDGMTYTFTLREATFHDGSPVTADDVVYCLTRAVGDELSQWGWIFAAVDTYEATDDSTVVANLKSVWVPFLSDLSLYAASIFPKAAHEAQGEELFQNPIGSGPFKWVSWDKEVEIKLTKYDGYWVEGQPYLNDLTFKVLTDANQRMLQFQSNELDIATDAPFSQLEALRSNPDVTLLTDSVARFDYIAINHERYPDVKVRQAINYAVDKDAIIANVLFGAGEMATTMLPKMLYWSDQVPGYPYDLDKAKALIAESEMADGFTAEILVTTGDPVAAQVAQLVADNLSDIGGEITVTQLEPAARGDRSRAMDYDMGKSYYTTDIIDPDELTVFACVSTGGTNAVRTGYKNQEVDDLALQGQTETDPVKRADIYHQIQQITSEDAQVLFLYYPTGRTAVHKYIQNFRILPTGNYRLWETWRNDV